MTEADTLEAELTAQLEEQQAALGGVQELLAADPEDAETMALLLELQAGIRETEEALLGLKRQRLLLELDALHSSQAGSAQQQQQQQEQQQQQQQQQQAAAAAAAAAASHLQPGSTVVFRHTDGRHYWGRVVGAGDEGTAHVQWLFPTRQFQLDRLALPASALHPAPGSGAGLAPAAGQLHAGCRLWAHPPGAALWAAAEVTEVDAAGQRVRVVTLQDGRRHALPLSQVALSVHAPSPHGDSDSEGGGGGGLRRVRSQGAASSSLYSGAGGASGYDLGSSGSGSGSGESGSDMDESGSEGEEGGYDEGGEGAPGLGAGRLSAALAQAAGLQQEQAAAGPQTDVGLFFASEGHSRGIGSKLLARMGFKGQGHGLGRQQQGIQQALQATRLKKGAGLGVDGGGGVKEGKHKRKSGKQRRRDKAAKAGFEEREAERQRQQQLEQQTGSTGLFAVLNSIVGDASQAHAVKQEGLGLGPAAKQAHLFGGSGGGGQRAAPKEEDRRALVQRADQLQQLRAKVQRLSDMASRNARDKVMLPQIRRALQEAQRELAHAEQQHAASSKAISDKEALRRMTKF